MNDLLAGESRRINRSLGSIMRQAPVADEAPLRLHSRDIDSGGAPEFHPAFLRYIDQGVCTCNRPAQCAPGCRFINDRALGHLDDCQPACRHDERFHASTHRQHPNRMKKALRQIRKINPKAYDLVYLVVALHFTFEQAAEKLRWDDEARGHQPRTDAEFALLWVSGASMLTAVF